METFITTVAYLTLITIAWHLIAAWWSKRKEEDFEEDFKIGNSEKE